MRAESEMDAFAKKNGRALPGRLNSDASRRTGPYRQSTFLIS